MRENPDLSDHPELFDQKKIELRYDGSDYEPKIDDIRLTGQLKRIFDCMKDGQWRTLDEIAGSTDDPPASVSAQLRHLRKERFGSHTVEKRARGERAHGLFEYRLAVNPKTTQQLQGKLDQ